MPFGAGDSVSVCEGVTFVDCVKNACCACWGRMGTYHPAVTTAALRVQCDCAVNWHCLQITN